MQNDELVIGEAVALDLRRAGLPSRVVAGTIDALAQVLLLVLLGALVAATGGATSSAGQAALVVVVLLVVVAGYPLAFETLWRGRTPGKAAMGLRVVRDDGGPVGFRQALVRALCGAFVERPGFSLFTLGVLTMLVNRRGKRLGDLLAGTVVLQERVAVANGPVAQLPPPLAAWVADLDLAGLTDELAVSARSYLARYPQLTPAAQQDLGTRLATAVAARVTPAPPPGTPAWAYLSAVLAERRRRAEQRLPTGARTEVPQAGGTTTAPAPKNTWAPTSPAPTAPAPPAPTTALAPTSAPAPSTDEPGSGFAPPG